MTRIKETLKKSDKVQSQSLDIPDQPGHYYSLSTETMLPPGAEPSAIEGESLLDNKIA